MCANIKFYTFKKYQVFRQEIENTQKSLVFCQLRVFCNGVVKPEVAKEDKNVFSFCSLFSTESRVLFALWKKKRKGVDFWKFHQVSQGFFSIFYSAISVMRERRWNVFEQTGLTDNLILFSPLNKTERLLQWLLFFCAVWHVRLFKLFKVHTFWNVEFFCQTVRPTNFERFAFLKNVWTFGKKIFVIPSLILTGRNHFLGQAYSKKFWIRIFSVSKYFKKETLAASWLSDGWLQMNASPSQNRFRVQSNFDLSISRKNTIGSDTISLVWTKM